MPPTAVVSGPSSIGAACTDATSSAVVFDASSTPASAGRPVTFAWSSENPTLQQLAKEAGNTPRLVLPGTNATELLAGSYTVQLNITNWLGANGQLVVVGLPVGAVSCQQPGLLWYCQAPSS